MNMTTKGHRIICALFGLVFQGIWAQDGKEADKIAEKALQESVNLTYEANEELVQNDFVEAEGDYRRAISKSGANTAAPYNLGRAYYNRESFTEAFTRFKEAGEKSEEKPTKHKAFHNMGNVFMKNKEYKKAVEAYKEALRNDPKDEETRYNLALAKEMLKNDQNNQNNDQNQDDQNKDDQQKKQDQNKEGDQDKDKEGDQKDEENKDKGDEGDQGDQKPEENKKGEGDEKEEQKKQPNQGEEPEKQERPRPNQLSKQQIQNLLEAMQNEERKVQEKIDAKKVRGKKIKNEKDW